MDFNPKIRRLTHPRASRGLSRLPEGKAPPWDAFPSTPKLSSVIYLAVLLVLCAAPGHGAVATPAGVDTDPLNLDPLVRQAYQRFYILDFDGALSRFEKVQTQNPANPLAVDFVLDTVIFRELYRLDLLDTTFYAHDGFLNGKHTVAPDHAVAERVNLLFDKAMELSNQRLKEHPEDVDALFARGWARSLHAVYIGLVERGFV